MRSFRGFSYFFCGCERFLSHQDCGGGTVSLFHHSSRVGKLLGFFKKKKLLLEFGDGVALLWLSFCLRFYSSTMSGLRRQSFFFTGKLQCIHQKSVLCLEVNLQLSFHAFFEREEGTQCLIFFWEFMNGFVELN